MIVQYSMTMEVAFENMCDQTMCMSQNTRKNEMMGTTQHLMAEMINEKQKLDGTDQHQQLVVHQSEMEYVETTTECQMKHEMMATILIIKAALVIDQVQSMDTHVVEVMKTQQIHELRHVEKVI